MSLQETAIYRVLRRAQRQGALKPDQDARALARLFLAIAQGMNVVYKATGDTIILKDIVDAAMELWKPKESRRLAERRSYR